MKYRIISLVSDSRGDTFRRNKMPVTLNPFSPRSDQHVTSL